MLLGASILLLILCPAAYAAYSTAPFVPVWESDLKRIDKLINLKPGDTFMELGSGTGRVLLEVAKVHPKVHVVGIEIQPLLYLYLRLRLALLRLPNVTVKWGDFLKADLSKANVVFMYLTPRGNERIGSQLKEKLAKGTVVISYAFEFVGWKNRTVSGREKQLPIYVYKI